jgi:hypothetical protein
MLGAIAVERTFDAANGLKVSVKTVETWKTRFDGAKEHRLSAYATLVFRTAERSLRAILGAIAVHLEFRRDGVNVA